MKNSTRYILLCGLMLGCAPDIAPDDEGRDELVLRDDEELLDDGSLRVTIDATSETDWIGYGFGDGILGADTAGDLDVQRYRVRLGDGIEAARLEGSFASVTEAPADGYTTDTQPLEEDEQYVFNDWYDYDYANHTLSPADVVFVLVDDAGLAVKVQIEDYYDDAGTPGFLTFRWAELGGAR